MAAIHWLAWITIGLVVIFTSRTIGGNIAVFMWVGLVFLLFGIAKAVHRFVFTPREKTADKPKHPMQHAQPQASQFVRCARCMTVASTRDNYCKVCGTMLRAQHVRR